MTQNLLKQLLRPRTVNRKNYKFIQRSDYEQSGSIKAHKYCLKNVLSPQFKPYDLYLMYFHKPQLKKEEEKQKKQPSMFYKTFVEFLFLHYELVEGSLDRFPQRERVKGILKQIMDVEKEQSWLINMTEQIIESCFKKYRDLQEMRQKNKMRNYQDILKIKRKIKLLFDQMSSTLELNCQEIFQREHFPDFITESKGIIPYVNHSFEKLQNLHVLLPYKKQQLINCMVEQLRSFASITFEKTFEKKPTKENERQGKPPLQIIHYNIIMPRFSQEREPVLTSIDNYVMLRRKQQLEPPQTSESIKKTANNLKPLEAASAQLANDLISFCRSFQMETNRVFPSLKISDVMFNQKTLRLQVSYTPLVYDALGVTNRKQGSIELQLAVNPTPAPFEFQQGNVEFGEAEKWSLTRKYYVQRTKKQQGQEGELYLRAEELEERQMLEGCPAKSKVTQQKAHVQRLLQILYFIVNSGRHLVQDEYNRLYGPNFSEESPTFYYKLYRSTLQQLQRRIEKDKHQIPRLLKMPQKKDISTSKQTFGFKLSQLQQLLKIQQKDELLQRMRFEKIISELWVRDVLVKEIGSLILNDRYFKKLLNAKKYIFMLLISSISYCYQLWLPMQQSRDLPTLKQMMIAIRGSEYRKLSFERERERKKNYIDSTRNKLAEYQTRDDQQKKYLARDKDVMTTLDQIYRNAAQLIAFEDKIMIQAEPEQKLASYLSQYKLVICKTIDDASKILTSMINIELERIDRIDDFHKLEASNKQLLLFINRKLFFLLKAFSTLSSSNWRKYQTLVLPILVDPKTLGIEYLGKRIEDGGEAELQDIIIKMDQVGELLKQEQPLSIYMMNSSQQ